ncbi:hypothetical protein DENSPDRAFT_565162 [Dentipellis sp. KUC8613]|nr:hypothetical protein DENSPDRAFT_565162 [Dentipellis sp. KUC8613]
MFASLVSSSYLLRSMSMNQAWILFNIVITCAYSCGHSGRVSSCSRDLMHGTFVTPNTTCRAPAPVHKMGYFSTHSFYTEYSQGDG